jgi:hypothetical protein
MRINDSNPYFGNLKIIMMSSIFLAEGDAAARRQTAIINQTISSGLCNTINSNIY